MTKLKSIRQTFLPDEGCLFVKTDYSQIEDRIGKMYCGTDRMVLLANSKPWEYDVHSDNAVLIFGNEVIDLPKFKFKLYRYLGKKVVHASWRKMGGKTMSQAVSKDTNGDVYMHPARCDRLIKIFLNKNPEIQDIYFPYVNNLVYSTGVLTNSWGRRYIVKGIRIDDDVLRGCYSYFMQSEGAGWTNQYLLLPGNKYMFDKYNKPLNLQIHDEVVASVPPEGLYDYCVYLKAEGEVEREIPAGSGLKLSVPLGITISDTLYGGLEFKRFPEDKTLFESKVQDYFGDLLGRL
jgi:DNA polymerase I-like protein with 3'-5' exonuclease and polymerase domains